MEPAQTPPIPGSSPRDPDRSPVLPEPIRAFLSTPRYATLSTIAADGAPHQAVIWYDLDGDDLVINSRRERHWPRNLLRDPRLSIAVTDAERPTHWVGVKGRALLVHEGLDATEDPLASSTRPSTQRRPPGRGPAATATMTATASSARTA